MAAAISKLGMPSRAMRAPNWTSIAWPADTVRESTTRTSRSGIPFAAMSADLSVPDRSPDTVTTRTDSAPASNAAW
jgi:hypothetical protein